MEEPIAQFESRKVDHIRLAMDQANEAVGGTQLQQISLIHEALPEINFSDIDISETVLGQVRPTPFLVSSMTAGHTGSIDINVRLAKACAKQGWLMGVGSQRREIFDVNARQEWTRVRRESAETKFLANIGISQLINMSIDQVLGLLETLNPIAIIVHTNPLQECLQIEGTPNFKGALHALESLVKAAPIPVVLKETGCGFSHRTLMRLKDVGLKAVDVSGFGGTHWGRIEGARSLKNSPQDKAANVFANWGISTVQSLLTAVSIGPNFEVWASGGVRSGLDAAKLIAMGARCVGLAKPILQAALKDEQYLMEVMAQIEFELKVALFCTGHQKISSFRASGSWEWVK